MVDIPCFRYFTHTMNQIQSDVFHLSEKFHYWNLEKSHCLRWVESADTRDVWNFSAASRCLKEKKNRCNAQLQRAIQKTEAWHTLIFSHKPFCVRVSGYIKRTQLIHPLTSYRARRVLQDIIWSIQFSLLWTPMCFAKISIREGSFIPSLSVHAGS